MKWLISVFMIGISCYAYGASQVANDYKDSANTLKEFRNAYDNLQDKAFTQVVYSTPNFEDMRDGEFFIYISSLQAPAIKLMIRSGTTVYASPDFNIIKQR